MARKPGVIKKLWRAGKADLARTNTNFRKFTTEQNRKKRVRPVSQAEVAVKALPELIKGTANDIRAYAQKARNLMGKKPVVTPPAPKAKPAKKPNLYERGLQRHSNNPVQTSGKDIIAKQKAAHEQEIAVRRAKAEEALKKVAKPAAKPKPARKPVGAIKVPA